MGVMMRSWQTVATTPAAPGKHNSVSLLPQDRLERHRSAYLPEAIGVCSVESAPKDFFAASKTEKYTACAGKLAPSMVLTPRDAHESMS